MRPLHVLMIKLTVSLLSLLQIFLLLVSLPALVQNFLYFRSTNSEIYALVASLLALGIFPLGIIGTGRQRWWGNALLVLGNIFWFTWLGLSFDLLLVIISRL
jgi:membrane protein YdbS with pleckstrin-like domain